MKAFDWVNTGDGRARFAGSIRGWDEFGHETFEVELDGNAWYGEIHAVFEQDGHDFLLEVSTFGYSSQNSIGILEARDRFDKQAAARIAASVKSLVEATRQVENKSRSGVIYEVEGSRFIGNVIFRDA